MFAQKQTSLEAPVGSPQFPAMEAEPPVRQAWCKNELQQWSELGIPLTDVRLVVEPQINSLLQAHGSIDEAGIAMLGLNKSVLLLITRQFLNTHKSTFDTIQIFFDRKGINLSKFLVSEGLLRYVKDQLHVGAQTASSEDSRSKELQEFFSIVRDAAMRGASDIHFCARDPGAAILFRIEGHLIQSGLPISYARSKDLIRAVYNSLPDKGSNSGSLLTFEAPQRAAIPCRINVRDEELSMKLRFQITPVLGGFDVVMRILFESGLRFERSGSLKSDLIKLGYLEDQASRIALSAMKSDGGIILSGVTGSGKTTTLYSILGHIAKDNKKTYSVEDPIEGKLHRVSQIQVNATEDLDADQAISEIVKSLLRLDPDITMVSEIRGPETGSAFKQLIQTGHQTLTTVHASSALDIYERLASQEIGIPRHVLSTPGFLSLLVYQKLLRRICDHCKVPLLKSDFSAEKIQVIARLVNPEGVYVTNPNGCEHCRTNPVPGVRGRTVCAEVVLPDHKVLAMMAEAKSQDGFDYLRQRRNNLEDTNSLGKQAMEVAIYKMSQGKIDPREVEQEFQPFELYLELYPYERPS